MRRIGLARVGSPGFRKSPEFQKWRALLHHFYDPAPVVEHFERVTGDGGV